MGTIENAVYVNQQMAGVAGEKNGVLKRFELQELSAAAATQEKAKEPGEVNPASASRAVASDREAAGEQPLLEKREAEHEKSPAEEVFSAQKPLHILDIKV